MRLHNFCIDRRIGIELNQVAGCSEVQPRLWMPTPRFDSDGRPLDFLDTADHSAQPLTTRGGRTAELKSALADVCLKRPGESTYKKAKRARANAEEATATAARA